MKKVSKPSYIDFDHAKYKNKLKTYSLRGEVGVLSYKYSKQISKYWKFKNKDLALNSAKKIYAIFKDNLLIATNSKDSKDKIKYFIRADICRKFLQMGYTRSMRYYYHKDGKKWTYKKGKWHTLPNNYDYEKKESANIFKEYWQKSIKLESYIKLKKYFKKYYSPKIIHI
jgi:hypothetical protein